MEKAFFSLSSSSDAKEFVDFKLQSFESYYNFSLAECTVDAISPLFYKLKLNCAAGVDGISAEHFCYCDSSIKEYICDLFNMCFYHGVIPKFCSDLFVQRYGDHNNVLRLVAASLFTIFISTCTIINFKLIVSKNEIKYKKKIVPIIKNKNKNVHDVSNYRPIAPTTVVSKLFESYILHHLIDFLKTNDNQFGFIPNHGTDMSVFLLKQVSSSYVSRDTPVFAVFLDASKVYDKVDHDLLFWSAAWSSG